jgi:hypothetical protein
MTSYNLRVPEGSRSFIKNGELYFEYSPRGLAIDSAAHYRAAKRLGMDAADPEDENSESSDNPNAATVAKMIAHGTKNFTPDDWMDLRGKAKDAHQDCIDRMDGDCDAMDTPPPFKGQPKTGASDAGLADANFIRRFPETFRIGRDDGYGSRQSPNASHSMSSKEASDFTSRFPGSEKIKVL